MFVSLVVRFRAHVTGQLTGEIDLLVKDYGEEDTSATDVKS